MHLKENARILRALEQGYCDFQAGLENENCVSLETLPSLHRLSDHLATYSVYLHRLLPYQCLRYVYINRKGKPGKEYVKKKGRVRRLPNSHL